MELFYAYLKHSVDGADYKYLIAFADRDAADEWWRKLSTYPSPFVGYLTRRSPQFYTQVGTPTFTTEYFQQLYEKGILTILSKTAPNVTPEGTPSAAPPIKLTDHISGKWYFIRSQSDPNRYWYFRLDGVCLVCGEQGCATIHVSTKHRSRFRIQARHPPKEYQSSNELVMIRSDEVSIAATKEYVLSINDAEELQATKGRQAGLSDFVFGDLKDRFATRAEKQDYGEGFHEYVVPVERGLGEAWEIVG